MAGASREAAAVKGPRTGVPLPRRQATLRRPEGGGRPRERSGKGLPGARAPGLAGGVPGLAAGFVALLALVVAAGAAAEDLLRVTCRGQFRLSVTEPAIECSESGMHGDPQGGMMSAFSAATANHVGAELEAGAAGGAIRHVGYFGREASALFLQRIWLGGEWQGAMPLTLTLDLEYGFGGHGEGRLHATLRSSEEGSGQGRNRAGLRMRHTEFGATRLREEGSTGNYALPEPGAYPSRSLLSLSVVHPVRRERPWVAVRADLLAFATPSLGQLEVSVSALATARATLSLSAPCAVRARSGNGVLPVARSGPEAGTGWRCGPAPPAPASGP